MVDNNSVSTTKPSRPDPSKRRALSPDVARLLEKLRSGGDVRSRKARRLRGAVRADRYENDLKLAIALDKLLREL